MEAKNDILWRVYLTGAGMFLFGFAIIGRVAYLQFVQGDYWKARAKELTTRKEVIIAERGNIFSVDGNLLATSYPIYELRFDAATGSVEKEYFDEKIDSLALGLSNVFGEKSQKQYKQELLRARKRKDHYFLIKRNVTYGQLKKVKALPILNLGKNKGGLIAIQKSRREKPYGILASRTVGYSVKGKKNVAVGLEGYYDSLLCGKNGARLMRKIAKGVWKPLHSENEVEPLDGNDVVSTIDVNIQDVAENALMKQMVLHKCDYGCAILMEVATGEIKAIANLKADEKEEGVYREAENIAVGKATDPGSTFKLLSAMALLEEGVKPTDSFNTSGGTLTFCKDVTIHDSHDGGYGTISLQRAFEVSSNVAFSGLVTKYFGKGTARGPQAFIKHIYNTGIHQKLGIDIPGEANPYIKNTEDKSWSCPTLPEMSIGYEVLITPLQTLTLYNAIANNGVMVKPHFIKRILNKGGVVKETKPEILNQQVCSPATVDALRKMMEGVVQSKGGTASNLKGLSYTIAGKTGTAVVANDDKGYKGENGKIYRASFVGYFPADKPLYSCIVLINNPKGAAYYGNVIAGPVFKEIADKVYSTSIKLHKELEKDSLFAEQGLPSIKTTYSSTASILTTKTNIPVRNQMEPSILAETSSTQKVVNLKPRQVKEAQIPDVSGMGIKDALYILENLGLQVETKGFGKVTSQSLPAGSKLVKGQKITLNFS